ncbi:hypothetical protein [Pseudoalteromonas phenolica]|uniref:Uncharacterized protein n=1 Tax=Pseudoalteromonas phenolica TaxID=161398 RepID=A0A0S2K3Z6_9GAMM|nr:hypothetical protein [Pseudoalteromonas phenolica]ALO42787.1 hypothetical protein PP2015_2290 [Pseudoalteromonas phenolica]MBE0356080.1 hypothetical protein [Pseudoalteromonas phenolica O-BC30]RXE99673.1 hypothetical protein D9981_09860 [Pseudoalteromonas phenolica O-BC30]
MQYPIILNVLIASFITYLGSRETFKRRNIKPNTIYPSKFNVYLIWLIASVFIPLPIHQFILVGEVPYWSVTIVLMLLGTGLTTYYLSMKINYTADYLCKTHLFLPADTYPLKSLLCISFCSGDANRTSRGYILEFSFGNLPIDSDSINIEGLLKLLESKGHKIPNRSAI